MYIKNQMERDEAEKNNLKKIQNKEKLIKKRRL